LCATTDRFQMTLPERAFFTGMGATMLGLRTVSRPAPPCTPRAPRPARSLEPRDIEEWALAELRSDLSVGGGADNRRPRRHHSRPWLGEIGLPHAAVRVNAADGGARPGSWRGHASPGRRHHRHRHR